MEFQRFSQYSNCIRFGSANDPQSFFIKSMFFSSRNGPIISSVNKHNLLLRFTTLKQPKHTHSINQYTPTIKHPYHLKQYISRAGHTLKPLTIQYIPLIGKIWKSRKQTLNTHNNLHTIARSANSSAGTTKPHRPKETKTYTPDRGDITKRARPELFPQDKLSE